MIGAFICIGLTSLAVCNLSLASSILIPLVVDDSPPEAGSSAPFDPCSSPIDWKEAKRIRSELVQTKKQVLDILEKNQTLSVFKWGTSLRYGFNYQGDKDGNCLYDLRFESFFEALINLPKCCGIHEIPSRPHTAPCHWQNPLSINDPWAELLRPLGPDRIFIQPNSIAEYTWENFWNADIVIWDYPFYYGSCIAHKNAVECEDLKPPAKRPGQIWILVFVSESLKHYAAVGSKDFTRMYDIRIGARPDIFNVQALAYFPGLSTIYQTGHSQKRLPNFKPTSRASFTNSNCGWTFGGRDEFVKQLMEHIPIDSFGKCLHNRDFPSKKELGLPENAGRSAEMIALNQHYDFVVLFENAFCHGWVTERLWEALAAGAIPIFRGAPDIEDYLPAPAREMMIMLTDFQNAKQVAAYLTFLDQNPKLIKSYKAWRLKPPKRTLVRILNGELSGDYSQVFGNTSWGNYALPR